LQVMSPFRQVCWPSTPPEQLENEQVVCVQERRQLEPPVQSTVQPPLTLLQVTWQALPPLQVALTEVD